MRIAHKNGGFIEGILVDISDELARRCIIVKSERVLKTVFADEIADFEVVTDELTLFIDQILAELSGKNQTS